MSRSMIAAAKALRAQRRRAGHGASYLVVVVGTFLACLGLISLVVLVNDVRLGQLRSTAASPIPIESDEGDAKLLYLPAFGEIDNHPVTVVVLEPLTVDAPLPPGLSRWPEPGQAYVSPQLANELAGSRARLYGEVAGRIDPDGLETPTERRVYLRPATDALQAQAMFPVQGFGYRNWFDAIHGTGYLYRSGLERSVLLVLSSLLLPGLVAVGIGAAIGAEHLRTTGRMLAAIGLSRRQLVQLDRLEHLPYCLTAALIACLATIWAMCCDVVLPFLDARYNATDTRQVAPLLLVAILAGTGACLAVVGLVRTRIRERMRHRERDSRADRGIYSAGFLLALTSGASLPVLLAPWPYVGHVATAAGFATIILSWAPISLVCSWVGRILVRVARLRSSPGTLIAGRFLEHLPRRVSLVALSMCAVIILAGLVQLHTSGLSGLIVQSQRDLARYGTSVLALNIPPGADPDPVIEHLLPEAGVLAIRRDSAPEPSDTISVNLSGSCAALKTLDLVCPDGQVDKTPTVVSSDRARYVVGQVPQIVVTQTEQMPQDFEELILVSLDETGLDLDSLQSTASRYLPGTIVSVRSTWNVAGADVALEEGWVLSLSALGGAVLILALTTALTKDLRQVSAIVAPVGSITGNPAMASSATAWSVSVPLLAAGVLGVVVYNILPLGMEHVIGDPYLPNWKPSPVLTAGALILTTIGTACSALAAWRAARRDVASWRPGQTTGPTSS